jgi:hypothetical protein
VAFENAHAPESIARLDVCAIGEKRASDHLSRHDRAGFAWRAFSLLGKSHTDSEGGAPC